MDSYKGWASVRYKRLLEATRSSEEAALRDLLPPDEKAKVAPFSPAQTLAMQQRILALMNFYYLCCCGQPAPPRPRQKNPPGRAGEGAGPQPRIPLHHPPVGEGVPGSECHICMNMKGRWTRAFLQRSPTLREKPTSGCMAIMILRRGQHHLMD